MLQLKKTSVLNFSESDLKEVNELLKKIQEIQEIEFRSTKEAFLFLLKNFRTQEEKPEEAPETVQETPENTPEEIQEEIRKAPEVVYKEKELEPNELLVNVSEQQLDLLLEIISNRKLLAMKKGHMLQETPAQILKDRFFKWDVLENWSGEFYTGLKSK